MNIQLEQNLTLFSPVYVALIALASNQNNNDIQTWISAYCMCLTVIT